MAKKRAAVQQVGDGRAISQAGDSEPYEIQNQMQIILSVDGCGTKSRRVGAGLS